MQKKMFPVHFVVQALIEFGPILMFIVLFHISHFYIATVGMVFTAVLLTALSVVREKIVPKFAIAITTFTVIFGFLTIYLHDRQILMVRDTIYDFVFALAIFGGLLKRKFILKTFFHHVIPLTDKGYYSVSYIWGSYFLVSGIINELVRHSGTSKLWVDFKTANILVTILVAAFAYMRVKSEIIKTATKHT